MTLGIPKPPPTCAHVRPTFGCDGCIWRDKQQILQEAVGKTPAPPCPTCGGPTVYSEKDFRTMTLYFDCRSCEDEVAVEVKR